MCTYPQLSIKGGAVVPISNVTRKHFARSRRPTRRKGCRGRQDLEGRQGSEGRGKADEVELAIARRYSGRGFTAPVDGSRSLSVHALTGLRV